MSEYGRLPPFLAGRLLETIFHGIRPDLRRETLGPSETHEPSLACASSVPLVTRQTPPRTTAKNNRQDQPFPSPPRQSRTESASGSPRSVHTPANTHAAVLLLLGPACHSADTAKNNLQENNLQDQPFPSLPRRSRTESASGSPRSVHTPANTHADVLRLLGLACHSADTAKNNLQEQPPRPAFSKSAQTKPDGISVRESEVCAHPSKHARSRTAHPRSRLSLGRHRQEQPPRTTAKTSLFQVRPDRAGRNQRPGVRGLCTPQQTRTQPYCTSSVLLVTRQTPPRTTSKNNRQDQPFPSLPRRSRTESASGSPRSVHTPANTHAAVLRLLSLACHSADTAKNNLQEQPPRPAFSKSAQTEPDGISVRESEVCAHPSKHVRSRTAPPRSRLSLGRHRQEQPPRPAFSKSAQTKLDGISVRESEVCAHPRKHARSRTAPPRSRLSLGRHRQEQPPRPAFSKSAQTKPDGISVRESEVCAHPRKHARSRTAPPRSRLSLGRHRQEQPPRTTSKTSLFQVCPDEAGRNQRPGVRGLCTPQQTRTQQYCASSVSLVTRQTPLKNNRQDQPFPSLPRQSRTESAFGSPRSVHTPANTHAAVLRLHATNPPRHKSRAEAPEKQVNAAFQRFAANTRKA